MSSTPASKTLDARGLYCPEPLFRAKMEMEFLNNGDVLEVWTDDPAAEEDFSSWTKRAGHQLLRIDKEGKTMRIHVRKAR